LLPHGTKEGSGAVPLRTSNHAMNFYWSFRLYPHSFFSLTVVAFPN
jgi:hypothetical protein